MPDEKSNSNEPNCWWLNASPKAWDISQSFAGTHCFYTSYNESGNKRRVFKNFQDAKPDDDVICYTTDPVKKITALASITYANEKEGIDIQIKEQLSNPIDYDFLKAAPELANMEVFKSPNGSLFKLTKEEYNFIMNVINNSNPINYSDNSFLSAVYMSEKSYLDAKYLLLNKKNIILQGPPGVGKTYAAKRLAYTCLGEQDDSRIGFVQFHQNYSYEDFIMGYKPDKNGFKLKEGIFYNFCQQAKINPGKFYFFIIDEINRGNLSKIFGELFILIEKSYRDKPITLPYDDKHKFTVPSNVYIIGTMNTADRSLAMMDYALRRRFCFFTLEPGFETEGFKNYQKKLHNPTFDALVSTIQELNKAISSDPALGKGFCIGHSYLCGIDTNYPEDCTTQWMQSVVNYEILPMLEEYWFDTPEKVETWRKELNGVFHDEGK